MALVSNPKRGDDVSVRQAIARLGSSKLGPTSTPTFLGVTTTSLTITGLTTNSLIYPVAGLLTSLGVAANGQIPIGSTGTTPVLATITGTANQVNVANAAGSITLSTPQDTHTGATNFTVAGLTVTGSNIHGLNSAAFQPTTDSATFFQILDADGGDYIFNVDTIDEIVDVGVWTGKPVDVSGSKFSVVGDCFIGNVGSGVGRLRVSSNANNGQVAWNTYFDGANRMAIDTAGSSWRIRMGKSAGGSDRFILDRAPATAGIQSFAAALIIDSSLNASITGTITASNYTAANLLTACATNAGALDFSAASKTLTVEDIAVVSQDYSSDATPQFTGVEVGHASDSTLTRVSAGDLSIEGNIIYRAGGTDVPVSDGGTGVSSLTDGGILLGSGAGAVTVLAQATNGQIPIGSTGADPVLAGITGTANQITSTSGAGSITLSTPQDIHTGATPTFARIITAVGTAAAPSHTFTGRLDDGFYSPAAGKIGFASAGNVRCTIGGTGASINYMGIGTETPTFSEGYGLEISAGAGSTSTPAAIRLKNNATTIAHGDTIGLIEFYNNDATGGTVDIGAAIKVRTSLITEQVCDMVFLTIGNEVVRIDYAGSTFLGDAGVTNYTRWSATGVQTMAGSAMVWKSDSLSPGTIGHPSTNPPDSDDYLGFVFDVFDDGPIEEQVFHKWSVPDGFCEGAASVRGHFSGLVPIDPDGQNEYIAMGFEYLRVPDGTTLPANFDTPDGGGSVNITLVDGEGNYTWHNSDTGVCVTTNWVHGDTIFFRFFRDVAGTYTGEIGEAEDDSHTGDAWIGVYHLEYLACSLGEST